jgi:hypothetical protein
MQEYNDYSCMDMLWGLGEERLVNRLFKGMPLGTRPKGRPKTRWKDQVHTDMKELKIQYTPDRAERKKQLYRAKD